MTTIFTHAVIPLTAGVALGNRVISRRLMVLGMLCAMIPDLDVISFHFGVPYDSILGHRGWTHSILFALMVGMVFAAFAKPLQTTRWKTFAFLSFATLSHGLLDAMTTGGRGIAFFWPFSDERYFLPFRFIRVSPIGMRFLSGRGWMTLQSELLTVWLPCLIFLTFIRINRLRKHDNPTA